jgi:hypothetical protein
MKNCLVLSHVQQPYYDFHLKEFEYFFDNVHNFMYMDFFYKFGLKSMENEILELISNKQITHIILWQWHSNHIPRLDFLNQLRENIFIILWLFDDDIYMHSHGKFYAQVSDVVVTTDWYGKMFYEQLNIKSVYYMGTYNKDIYKPLNINKNIDVSFVGAINKADRKEYIDFLLENNISIEYFGRGSKNNYISEEQMVQIFNKSKINLNFSKIGFEKSIYESTPFVSRIRQNKGRPLEIGLTKSFCLTESAPSLNYLFDIETELDTFNDKEELLRKIKYYLANYEEAEKKANLMYQKSISQYEKDVYFPIIFEELLNIYKNKNINDLTHYDIEKSMNFRIKEKSFYFKIFLNFFKNKKYALSFEMLILFFKNTNLPLIFYSIVESYKVYGKGTPK